MSIRAIDLYVSYVLGWLSLCVVLDGPRAERSERRSRLNAGRAVLILPRGARRSDRDAAAATAETETVGAADPPAAPGTGPEPARAGRARCLLRACVGDRNRASAGRAAHAPRDRRSPEHDPGAARDRPLADDLRRAAHAALGRTDDALCIVLTPAGLTFTWQEAGERYQLDRPGDNLTEGLLALAEVAEELSCLDAAEAEAQLRRRQILQQRHAPD